MTLRRILIAAVVVLAACAQTGGPERIGPITIEPPAGFQVTRESRTSLQMADGTAGTGVEAEAGTATAVFDVYVNSRRTPESYRELVAEEGGEVLDMSTLAVDGEEAVVIDYEGESFAGRQTAVLIRRGGIVIVYRAAFQHDDEAYEAGRPALIDAVRSIRFVSSTG